MEKLYIVGKNQTRSWLWLNHELLIAKFRLQLKKVGKTTRPLTYDLNQIPYDYTVEVTDSFKGLDLTDTVPEELWTEIHDTVQETGIKTIPKKKKCKMVVWGDLTNNYEKKRSERQRGKGKIYPFECTVLYKKDLHDLDNHDGVITHLEPDILECKVKWALGASLWTKLGEVMEFQLSYFKS